ncbi:MAG: WD40 repeat domain-containing protein, partial [Verrucomicrobia bacterium]|nr:WD40 repeat domain-containing protein [Verrucomicrobiota bacterium]
NPVFADMTFDPERRLEAMRMREAEQFFSAGDSSTALSCLARELRDNPGNRAAAERLVSALTQRSFPLPACRPVQHVQVFSDPTQGPPGVPFAFSINAAEFSPDGRWVVTAADDKTAQVWDALTLQPRGQPLQHSDRVLSVRFSPNSRQVLTVVDNDAAYLWESWGNSPSPPLRKALKHGARVSHAEFCSDGRWVLTASDDSTLQLWDAHTGEPTGQCLKHSLGTNHLGFGREGRFVRTFAHWVGGISHWESLSEEDRGRRFAEHVALWEIQTSAWQSASAIEFSPEGQCVLVAGSSVGALICDTRTGQVIEGFKGPQHDGHILFAKYSPDGQRFVTGSDDTTARLWDAHTGQPLTEPLKHDEEVTCAEFSPDGQRLVTVAKDGIVRIWDAITGDLLSEEIRTSMYGRAQFSPDGQHLLVIDWASIQVWDIRVGHCLAESLQGVAKFSPIEPEVMLVNPWDGQFQTWTVQEMRTLSSPFGHAKCVPMINGNPTYDRAAQFSLDGRLVSTIEGNTVGVWDAHTGKPVQGPVQLEKVPEPGQSLEWRQRFRFMFSPDGLRIYAIDEKALKIWDTWTGRLLVQSPLPRRDPFSLAEFSPDGRLLAMECAGCFRVWDAHTGSLAVEPYGYDGSTLLYRTWPSPKGEPEPFACSEDQVSSRFSLDGKRLVTAHRDGSAWIWDAGTGQVLVKFLKHSRRANWAEFSLDGRYVVTASDDKTARVWDSHTGEPLLAPLMHQSRVEVAEFSREGQRIVTLTKDGTTRLWDAQSGLALTEPQHHREPCGDVEFNSDGNWICVQTYVKGCWDTPLFPSPAPGWLPELAEAVAGHRLTPRRTSETVPEDRLLQLKEDLAAQPGDDYYSRWVRWFFADRSTRTISPQSAITLPQYIERRMQGGRFEALREAVRLSPSNGLAVARLAQSVHRGYEYSRDESARLAEADFLSRHAVKLAPQDAGVAKIRAEIEQQIKALNKP